MVKSAKDAFQNVYLKSNMDRFIFAGVVLLKEILVYLKSNMDRFISAFHFNFNVSRFLFKIQYG